MNGFACAGAASERPPPLPCSIADWTPTPPATSEVESAAKVATFFAVASSPACWADAA
jgi:hypothetical protein